jgi:hypothetical protein
MFLILCHPGDEAAFWLHDALRRDGLDGVEAVAVEALVYSRRIVHRMDDGGDEGEIELADGRVLRPEAIRGLVNRVGFLPQAHVERAAPGDKAYAVEELNAFLLAWLNGVGCRVINPALPLSLDGGAFPAATLFHMAAMAGLPTGGWRSDASDEGAHGMDSVTTHNVVVFDGRLFGPLLPQGLQAGCRQLAVLLGVPLLQVAFHHSGAQGWRFRAAHGLADFRIGGRPLASAIAGAFAPDEAEA